MRYHAMGEDTMGVMRIADGIGRSDVDGPAWDLPPLVSASSKRDKLLHPFTVARKPCGVGSKFPSCRDFEDLGVTSDSGDYKDNTLPRSSWAGFIVV